VALTVDHRRTLYLNTVGTHVAMDHDAFEIRRPEQAMIRVPVRGVDSIVCFGNAEITTSAMARCAIDGIHVSWLSRSGRFRLGLRGPTHGNVLLRVKQYAAASELSTCLDIARTIVAAKLLNSRVVLLDAAKDRDDRSRSLRLGADELLRLAEQSKSMRDLDSLRGTEGAGARRYFHEWASLLSHSGFEFAARQRRPPTDPVNALLSFGYSLLRIRCEAAAEHVGLDPQVGFLHPVRPGRPSLALDLMEELRAPVVDRLVLTMINRKQLANKAFEHQPTGGVRMTDDARAAFLTAFDSHMTSEVPHRVLEEPIERRKIPALQALLLARYLRGDLGHYLPYRTTGR
jgi:CRISP-associated protein Cas1